MTNEQEKPTVTRAEKANRMKSILRGLLQERTYKWNELLDASVKSYTERYPEDAGEANDLKGRMGSVLSLMEDGGEMRFEAGVCSLIAKSEEKADAAEKGEAKAAEKAAEAKTEEKGTGKKSVGRRTTAKAAEKTAEKTAEEKAEEAKPETKPEVKKVRAGGRSGNKAAAEKAEVKADARAEEAAAEPAPKKRGRKPKAEVKEEASEQAKTSGTTEKAIDAERTEAAEKAELAPKKRGRKAGSAKASEKLPLPSVAEKEDAKAEKEQPKVEITEEKAPASAEDEIKASAEDKKSEEEKILAEEKAEIRTEAPLRETNEQSSEKTEEGAGESASPRALTVKPEAKVAPVFDMTLLFGGGKKGSSAKAGAEPVKETAKEAVKEPAAAKIAERSAEKGGTAEKTAVSEKTSVREKAAEKKPVLSEFAFLGNAASASKDIPVSAANELKNAAVGAANMASAEKEAADKKETRERVGQSGGQASFVRTAQPQAGQAVQTAARPQAQQARIQPKATAKGGASDNGAGAGNGGAVGRRDRRGRGRAQTPAAPETPEEALKTEFLRRLRALGGDYFEYYSVYLLERYSLKNGRRLEGMRVSGGGHDGGVDGEIELTDKFGFRETIYIQSKNWDPSKGKEELWVIGETLLQQFIGAVACRQAKDCKQHSRGIFITTSHFTPEARELLERMSDKFIGYDGDDIFETAKECSFGIIRKDGEWALDEELLSGGKAFFNML